MRKQLYFDKNGKDIKNSIGITGTIKQIFVNSYRTEEVVDPNAPVERKVVTKLTNTKIDFEIGGLRLLEDYYGAPVDDFNILTEEFEVADNTSVEINIDGELASGSTKDLKFPVVVTLIYELPEKQKRTILR
jgi:hypothetical protein